MQRLWLPVILTVVLIVWWLSMSRRAEAVAPLAADMGLPPPKANVLDEIIGGYRQAVSYAGSAVTAVKQADKLISNTVDVVKAGVQVVADFIAPTAVPATATPSGALTTSAPEILRDALFPTVEAAAPIAAPVEILTGATEFGVAGGGAASAGIVGAEVVAGGFAPAAGAVSPLAVDIAVTSGSAIVAADVGLVGAGAGVAPAAATTLTALQTTLIVAAPILIGLTQLAIWAATRPSDYIKHREKVSQGMNIFVPETLERVALSDGTEGTIRRVLSEIKPTVQQFRYDLMIPEDIRQAHFSGGYEIGEAAWGEINSDLQAIITAMIGLQPFLETHGEARSSFDAIHNGWAESRKKRLLDVVERMWWPNVDVSIASWTSDVTMNTIRWVLEGTWLGENGWWYGPGRYSWLASGFTMQEVDGLMAGYKQRALSAFLAQYSGLVAQNTQWSPERLAQAITLGHITSDGTASG